MMTIISSDLFLIVLTIGLFLLSGEIFRRTRLMLLHPVLLTAVAVIVFLKLAGIEYAHYKQSVAILDFALGMSVVALGYLMYEQVERLKSATLPVLGATIVGCIVGIGLVVGIALCFGMERDIITSIAPKSVTVPIAIAISEPRGGVVAVTSVVVFCTGVLGSICGAKLLSLCGVKDPMARGFALGAASHGIGTARAIELGAVEGAMSGLAMALTGFGTAVLLPIVEKYLY
ncbi:MAG: LrgB family protein [Alistipes sp.]|jgi:predicted murein hydrolase (TIGR00659 family)|nr:LrgB family protein [Alistipes sp.]